MLPPKEKLSKITTDRATQLGAKGNDKCIIYGILIPIKKAIAWPRLLKELHGKVGTFRETYQKLLDVQAECLDGSVPSEFSP